MDHRGHVVHSGEGFAMDDTYFTDKVRVVLQLARDESQRLGARHIGAEHILLAMLKHGNNSGADALVALGIDTEEAAETLEAELRASAGMAGRDRDKAHAAKHLLRLADHLAADMGPEGEADVSHLLLAILTFEAAPGVALLVERGVTFEAVTHHISRL